MNRTLKRTVFSSLLVTGLAGTALLPMKPAAADDHLVRNVGIGAATGAVSGIIFHHSPLGGAVNGAAAGAAVTGANHAFGTHPGHRDLPRDAAVGGAAGVVTGVVTGPHRPLKNTIDGAAAGAVINLLTR
jgi:hypothetical protein